MLACGIIFVHLYMYIWRNFVDELVFAFCIRVLAVARKCTHTHTRQIAYKVTSNIIIMENTYILVWQQLSNFLQTFNFVSFFLHFNIQNMYMQNNKLHLTVWNCEYIQMWNTLEWLWKEEGFRIHGNANTLTREPTIPKFLSECHFSRLTMPK